MLFSKIIRKRFDAVLGRYDGSPACYYFSPVDFKGIKTEGYDIRGDRDITLKGNFYYYGDINPAKLVIFDHGIGAGHLAYFKEIELLARNGYTIYSYDHTGCVESGGKGILGFAQGINDLEHVILSIKNDRRFAGSDIRIVGHSWGGYSAMNVAALQKSVTHVVSLAGFVSAKSLIEQYLPKFVMRYSGEVMERERRNNIRYADMDARISLKNSHAKFMYIQSEDDNMVHYDLAYIPLLEALKDRKNTEFISLKNRRHEPQHTDRAVIAYAEFSKELAHMNKNNRLMTKEQQENFRKKQDWNAMTEQDPIIWNKIFEFLEK